MKPYILLTLIALSLLSCSNKQIGTSEKTFPPISLINHFEYFKVQKYTQLGTAFLLKYRGNTYAITAKHTLAFLKPDSAKNLTTEGFIKRWTMSPLNHEHETVVVQKLLNANKNEELKSKKKFDTDWLVFSIDTNNTQIQALELRETPIQQGEKCYAVGWTRHMKEGDQRVYEFEYYKPEGTHHLMKQLLVPESMGGLSGAPVVDNDGKLVGIVSGSQFCFSTMQNMFWPVGTDGLKTFLDNYQATNNP